MGGVRQPGKGEQTEVVEDAEKGKRFPISTEKWKVHTRIRT